MKKYLFLIILICILYILFNVEVTVGEVNYNMTAGKMI